MVMGAENNAFIFIVCLLSLPFTVMILSGIQHWLDLLNIHGYWLGCFGFIQTLVSVCFHAVMVYSYFILTTFFLLEKKAVNKP